ncbi:transporter, putative [Plasmodium berghei]|uniref:Mitochondrial carrier protein, putative n=2 Tax=Plasmodium berghei TaxID=5821 RepID=A0A509AJ78_PLABA|nr:mitochondrial carrier protein, putative [Plasmodium berghei ANKA]CXI30867.1 transporter, putative [Plasmodium berghei]SCM20919.1 transporter, putative [Plasmodium berghei]SCN24378.1 transporter, putative [Plasmodium berghei]SCO59557.1 transporter, putative [Plasmodium berghei]SCO60769.1 transporter, putative [Plasmodium berghei]|eukprot:XP_034421071.1 mitochondrial carrier protein, putative [Plasmodium berghei ANKA]
MKNILMEKYNDYLHEIDCKKLINNKSENIMNENNSKKCNIKNLYLQNKLSRKNEITNSEYEKENKMNDKKNIYTIGENILTNINLNTHKNIRVYCDNIKNSNVKSSKIYEDKDIKKRFNILIDKENAINSILSSTYAGIISRTVTAPLDRIKYIMQITNNLTIYEIFDIIKKDGTFCGFFRGNCVNIVKIIPELSIKMYSYEFMKVNVYNYYNKNRKNSNQSDNIEQNLDIPFFIRFLIGSSSGVIAAIFIYPFEIVKTRLIVSNKDGNNGILKCLYNIYKYEGFRNFYNGLCMHIYGVIFFSGCNMSIYDYLKYKFFEFYKHYIHSNYCMKENNNNKIKNDENLIENTEKNKQKYEINNSLKNNKDKNSNNFYQLNKFPYNYNSTNFLNRHEKINQESHCLYCNYRIKNVNCLSFLFFGITSSFIAQIVSYPFLVLRTRMQTMNNEIATNYLNNERKHIKSCSFILYNIRVYGFKSLYRGIYVNLLKTIPATSITWFSYEYAMRKLKSA